MRVGIGYDIHRLKEGKKLVIGGTEIEYNKGFEAHSDGDILFHSLTDALLGAVGYGDIGELFPDTDQRYRGLDSSVFLKEAVRIVHDMGYKIGNVDSVIIIQKPKLLPYRDRIRGKTADVLGIEKERVFLKAKTNEGLDSLGSEIGASCYSVVILYKE
ncbi:MAG: 2-C-methyl-D-erythritol 2,4-cyclodiphosphate synthase [Hydrogenothermaceae bacterium]|nr:2-C-methyl-D-erythritol 2,4-cyclodiphosphate synthase [Hydrogenothermaceae bacterium]